MKQLVVCIEHSSKAQSVDEVEALEQQYAQNQATLEALGQQYAQYQATLESLVTQWTGLAQGTPAQG